MPQRAAAVHRQSCVPELPLSAAASSLAPNCGWCALTSQRRNAVRPAGAAARSESPPSRRLCPLWLAHLRTRARPALGIRPPGDQVPWAILYYKAPGGTVPALKFLDAFPGKIDAESAHNAVICMPPGARQVQQTLARNRRSALFFQVMGVSASASTRPSA